MLTGEEWGEVVPDTDALVRILEETRRTCTAKLRDDEWRSEILEVDRASVEASGLASIDADGGLGTRAPSP